MLPCLLHRLIHKVKIDNISDSSEEIISSLATYPDLHNAFLKFCKFMQELSSFVVVLEKPIATPNVFIFLVLIFYPDVPPHPFWDPQYSNILQASGRDGVISALKKELQGKKT